MAKDDLFGDVPVQMKSEVFDPGRPRLRQPVRDQIELRAVDLDRLIGPEHPARVIWDYVQDLDLRALEQSVRAREHTPGQARVSRNCCWRFGFARPARESEARGRWPGCAKVTMLIAGCAAA